LEVADPWRILHQPTPEMRHIASACETFVVGHRNDHVGPLGVDDLRITRVDTANQIRKFRFGLVEGPHDVSPFDAVGKNRGPQPVHSPDDGKPASAKSCKALSYKALILLSSGAASASRAAISAARLAKSGASKNPCRYAPFT
jgi:hypothetical protein